MDGVVSGPSAFRYWRIPPQVLALCPPLPSGSMPVSRKGLVEHPVVRDILGLPLHRLFLDEGRRSSTKHFANHACSGELPAGSVFESELGFDVCSPALTLLTLVPHVPFPVLAMAAYEMCGTFAVFAPSRKLEQALASPRNRAAVAMPGAWRRVRSADGKDTDLWQRPPLMSLDDLRSFAAQTGGLRGHRALVRAATAVRGPAASPFEVQTALLLGLDRRLGGRGVTSLLVNERINLPAPARRVAGRSYCVADIFLPGEKGPDIDLECQSRLIHDASESALSDSDRFLALQMAGLTVLPATFGQVFDEAQFEQLVRHITKLRGQRYSPPTPAHLRHERELRRYLFSDWTRLVG